MKAIKNKLAVPLQSFLNADLRRICDVMGIDSTGASTTDMINVLEDESASLVERAIEKVMSSGMIGQPYEKEGNIVDVRNESDKASGVSAHEMKVLMDNMDKIRTGMINFAENIDKRMDSVESNVKRVVEGEPLRIQVDLANATNADGSPKIAFEGIVHKEFQTMLKMAQAGVNILMVGPAGSGKTTAAEMVSKALNRPFFFNGAIDTEYKLKGFTDAQGRVVKTAFRDAFENGGVYLFDEVDASQPAATMAFNSALANGWCDFPDKRVTRHPDTVIIAAANTFLGGATFEYVGRNKQDAAFIDRFVTLAWDYDDAMEKALCSHKTWCDHVQRVRAKAKSLSLKVIISPRASFEGAKMLNQGLPWEFVEKSAIKKGMTDDQWNQISR